MIDAITDVMQGHFVNLYGDVDVMLHPTRGLLIRQSGMVGTVLDAAQLAHMTRLCQGILEFSEVVVSAGLQPPIEGGTIQP